MTICPANSLEHIRIIEKLAHVIIPDHYNAFVPEGQIYFFLKKYQTAMAIEEQIKNGSRYYLLKDGQQAIGYFAIMHEGTKTILDKLYILKEYRRKKLGNKTMNFLSSLVKESGSTKIELVVNKNNLEAVKFYISQGFQVIETFTHELYEDNCVEDYRMQKLI